MILSKKDVSTANLAHELQALACRIHLSDLQEALFFPKYFQIETVRLCNARCPFCASDRWDKSVPYMSDALFEQIVQELERYSHWISFVAMQRAGEPLMDRKIVQRVRRVKMAGIRFVSLSTNASLLTEKKAIELLSAGLDEIMLSIDSIDKSEYEKMRVGLDYEKVIQNIETLFAVRDRIRSNTIVRVRGISFPDPDKDRDRDMIDRWEHFWDRFKKPKDRIYLKRAHNWGNQKQWDDRIPQYDWVYHPCVLPWSTLHITTSGTVPLCPQDYDAKMNIGNVAENSIAEIWEGENWRRVRRLHQAGRRNEIPFCRGCRLFDEDFSLEKKTDGTSDPGFFAAAATAEDDGQ